MSRVLQITENAGIQESLFGEELILDDDVILENSNAICGVRHLRDDEDYKMEIFDNGRLGETGLDVYPLDSRDLPIAIDTNLLPYESFSVQAIASATLVARAQGIVP